MSEPIRVLLVEDQPTDRLLIEEALGETSFLAVELTVRSRLRDATDHLAAAPADVVLLDLGLPDSEGVSTFQKLHDAHPDVPVVVVTGHADEALGIELVHQGAQDYLVKGQITAPLLGRALRYAVERRRAARVLEEAGRRKSEFLAMLAHELRNPLAPIATAAELMKLVGSLPPQLETARAIIGNQVRHMARLIDDLLDVSRFDRGKMRIVVEAVDVRESVRRAVEQTEPAIARSEHRLTLELPDEPLVVEADATRLTQVVANLLGNAAKYTPAGGNIAVRARHDGTEALIEVIDDGPGFAEEAMEVMFELFVQGEQTIDRSSGGLGVGLTLARAIVELHAGRIEAFSDGPGEGARFVVRIPCAAHKSVVTGQ